MATRESEMSTALEDSSIVSYKRDTDIKLESWPRRVRVVFNGEVVADSDRVKLLLERRHLPVFYFPPDWTLWSRRRSPQIVHSRATRRTGL
jgi:uncharacterized protein (DUF427 family)